MRAGRRFYQGFACTLCASLAGMGCRDGQAEGGVLLRGRLGFSPRTSSTVGQHVALILIFSFKTEQISDLSFKVHYFASKNGTRQEAISNLACIWLKENPEPQDQLTTVLRPHSWPCKRPRSTRSV